MTFPNDGTRVVKMECSEEEISAVLAVSEQERKRLRNLGKVMETVAAYRLKELQHFQVMEQLVTWRMTHGYDRDDSWMHGTRPLSPQEITASLWSDLQELKDAISISGRSRSWQKARELLDGLEGDLPDEELAAIKRYVERRSREASQVTVTPDSTVQPCIPRSPNPEIPSDVYVSMEEKDEGRMNPEPTELESTSAGTGLEAPGQQCPPKGETRRTTADGYLLVGMGSNQGGDTSSPTERVGTQAGRTTTRTSAASNITFLQQGHKLRDKTPSEENKQFEPGGKGEKPALWNAAVMLSFSFYGGGRWAAGCPLLVLRVFLSVCVFLSALFIVLSGDHFFSELKNMRGDAKKINQEPGGQAPSCLSTP